MILVFGPTIQRKRGVQKSLAPDNYQGVAGAFDRDNALVTCGSGDCDVSVQTDAAQSQHNSDTRNNADETIALQ